MRGGGSWEGSLIQCGGGALGRSPPSPPPTLVGVGRAAQLGGGLRGLLLKRLDRQTDVDNNCVSVSVAILAQGVSLCFCFSHPPNPKQVYLVQDNHRMIVSWQVWREG